MSASEKGHAEVVQILIAAGASRSITKDKVRNRNYDDLSCIAFRMKYLHYTLLYKMDMLKLLKLLHTRWTRKTLMLVTM